MQIYLIHGGWQGGWCWDLVAAELERRGHQVVAPTLPGLEPDPTDRAGIGLSTMVDYVTDDLVARDLSDVVIVGHSGGGAVAQGVGERAGGRIRRIAYMSARLLLDGECILDHGDPVRRAQLEAVAAASPDQSLPMDEELWIAGLCADMSKEEARSWLPQIVKCPVGWVNEPIHLPTGAWREIPSAFIFLDAEPSAANARYERMAARLNQPRIAHCPGGHQAMLSQPIAVADAILLIAGDD
jgi:pimeloyl-ACP methyl ester carboxylesterase